MKQNVLYRVTFVSSYNKLINQKMAINELKARAYEIACKHGWYEKETTHMHERMMIITELSEAVNADRKGKYADRYMFEQNASTPQVNPERHWNFCFETFIKDSVEDELADAFIRFLSVAGREELVLPEDKFDKDEIRRAAKSELEGMSEEPLSEHMFLLVYELVNFDRGIPYDSFGIHLLLIAYAINIDLYWFVEQKMKYNESRPYMHGKKY